MKSAYYLALAIVICSFGIYFILDSHYHFLRTLIAKIIYIIICPFYGWFLAKFCMWNFVDIEIPIEKET